MSVLIRGMKIPESCEKCKLDLRTDVCPAFDEWHKEHPYSIRAKDRLPDCPLAELPEKHGRLIDADKIDFNMTNAVYRRIAEETIAEAPAVLEAE